MTFEEAMHFVEHARRFPGDVAQAHGERFRELIVRAGLVDALVKVPSVVVAGSAGKGSTARLIACLARALLDAEGDRRPVILGTKPPLRETDDGHRERYQGLAAGASATWIERKRFAEHVAAMAPHVLAIEHERPELGRFAPYDLRYAVLARETVTSGAAFAVVEANIGLRRDVSRGWPGVRAIVLTPIGTEHGTLLSAPVPVPAAVASLGSCAGPAWHKAGGVLPGIPVVTGRQAPDMAQAIAVLTRDARAGELFAFGESHTMTPTHVALDGAEGTATVDGHTMSVHLGLLGAFQLDNAATALQAARVLQRSGALPGDVDALREATSTLASVRAPGRMEIVSRDPLTIRNATVSLTKARAALDVIASVAPDARLVVCLSVIARVEDREEIVRVFARCAAVRTLFVAAWHSHGDQVDVDPWRIAKMARHEAPALDIRAFASAATAISAARAACRPGEVLVLVGDGVSNAWEERASSPRGEPG